MLLITKILNTVLPITLGIYCCWYIAKWPVEERVPYLAGQYVGIEDVDNRHPEVDWWNTKLGVPLGSNYCATFVSHILDTAEVRVPSIRTGVAQRFITNKSIPAARVVDGMIIPPGSIVIWKRGESWMGHTELTREEWQGPTGNTIGANTSPGPDGPQRTGTGVYERTRTIDHTAFFRITHFTLTSD